MKKNILNLYEGFLDDLDKLNQDKVNNEFGEVNSGIYDEHDIILSPDKNPKFFYALCEFCKKYYPNLPSNENKFTQEDLDKIIHIDSTLLGFSYFQFVTSLLINNNVSFNLNLPGFNILALTFHSIILFV